MIDVGQGDAILVQFPSGQSLLIDTGGVNGAFDIGGRVVTPAAWALGVTRLDWLAFTHPDLDHIGGAQSVVRDLVPREIWEGISVPKNRARADLYAAVTAAHLAWRTVLAGQTIEMGGATVQAISPPAPDWERPVSRNDDSIVLRIEFGHVAFLLTGDAGREFESRPLGAVSPAALRVLKVGHHGSRSSSSEAFLRAWRPDLALISAGRGNLFGHPAPDVVARLVRLGSEVVRTDRDGAVMVETDGRTIDVRTAAGRAWSIRADVR
jgi:competence protein ComEC